MNKIESPLMNRALFSQPRSRTDYRGFFLGQSDYIQFSGLAEEARRTKYPESKVSYISPGKKSLTIPLRQWVFSNQTSEKSNDKVPVYLLIHGLGGRSEWMSPLAQELNLKTPGTQIYGIDLPNVGQHQHSVGHIASTEKMINKIKDTITYLSKKEQRPVVAIGTSLGGLLLSHAAIDKPEGLAGIGLISPVYKSHSDLKKDLVRGVLARGSEAQSEKIKDRLKERKEKTLPDVNLLTPLQKKVRYEKETVGDSVRKLTLPSYLKISSLMRNFRNKKFKKFDLPVFAVVTRTDDMIDTETTIKTLNKLSSKHKQIKIYDEGAHDLVVDPVLEEVTESITDWIKEIL